MSEYAIYFFYILRKDANISDIKNIILDFSHSVEESYQIALFEHRDFTKKSDFTNIPRKKIENIDSYIVERIDNLKQAGKSQLSLTYMFEENSNLDIGFSIVDRSVIFSVNYNFFNYDYFRGTNKRVNAFLCFCKEVYRFFSPAYGYGITEINDWSSPERVLEIDQLKLNTLYCYNFLGPDLTARYGGINALKDLPAWQVQEMNDGGVFLAIEENPISPESLQQNYMKAIELLKIPRFIRAG
jgi:hypothetical protein